MRSFNKKDKVLLPEFDLFALYLSVDEVVVGFEDFDDFFGVIVVV